MAYVLVDLRQWQPGTEMSPQLKSNLFVAFTPPQHHFKLTQILVQLAYKSSSGISLNLTSIYIFLVFKSERSVLP